jgi:broad specificity phosphatase PhoE
VDSDRAAHWDDGHTAHGERPDIAQAVGTDSGTVAFKQVLTSPLQRARETCELAGLGDRAEIDRDLVEWNYGEYEGLTAKQIDAKAPGWMLFRDGCPSGESPEDVGRRVDSVIERVRRVEKHVALFAHGHVFRVFAARWIGLPPGAGCHFLLDTATLSVLSYYRGVAAIKRWNAPVAIEGIEVASLLPTRASRAAEAN